MGVLALYSWYLAAAVVLRGRWRIDLKLGGLRDVQRFVLVLLSADFFNAVTGMLTLLGDGLIRRSEAIRTTVEWWASDGAQLRLRVFANRLKSS